MMKFLKRFWTILIDYLPLKSRSLIIKKVRNDEPVARYLTSTRWFSPKNKRVKHNAFLPPSNMRLSVFLIKDLTESRIWEIGQKKVVNKIIPRKNLYGRANIKALDVFETGLEIQPDNIPPRHAEIVDWPDEKSKRKEIALELAEKALLILRPD